MAFRRPIAALVAVALGLLAAPPNACAQSLLFDFNNTIWNHSAFGGPASSVGWTAGQNGGTATHAATGLKVTVSYLGFGTANLDAGSLRNSTLSNGEVSLAGLVNNDFNAGATITNYAIFRVRFSRAVQVGTIRAYDVDDTSGTSWQDFISIQPTLGGSAVAVNYAVSNATNQQITTYKGVAGVLGVNNVNPGLNTTADVFASVGSASIDQYEMLFTQGPQGTSAVLHGVGLYSILVTSVPEPGSVALVGFAAAAAWWRTRRRPANR